MPLMVSMLKITVRQSIAISSAGMPSIAILRAVTHVREHVAEARGIARHLQPDVEALPSYRVRFCTSASFCSRTLTARVTPIFSRQFQPVGIQIGDHREARARMPRHRRRHDADGTGAGDQHILAQHRKRERRVHRVAERIENRRDIEIDCRRDAARYWSSAARCIRRTRPGGSRRRPWCARTGGAARRGSCGSGRRPRGLRR